MKQCTSQGCEQQAVETIRLRNGNIVAELCNDHFEDYAYFFTKAFLKKQEEMKAQ